MKTRLCFFAAAIGILLFTLRWSREVTAKAAELSEEYFMELEGQKDYQEMKEYVNEMLKEQSFDFSDYIRRVLRGEEGISLRAVSDWVISGLSGQIHLRRLEFSRLIGIVLFTAVFTGFSKAFRNGQVAESGYYVAYLLLFSMLAAGYLEISGMVAETLKKLVDFMKMLVPVFQTSLLVSTGVFTSKIAASTLLLLLALVDELLIRCFLPVVHVYMMAVLVNHLTEEEPFTKFTELMRKGIRLALKALLGFVIGISMLQSMIAPAMDQTKRKGLQKLAECIPGIGNMLGSVSETVLGAGRIIRNAIGSGGIVVISLVCVLPILRVLLSVICYRAGAAIVEPVADKRIVHCLNGIAEGMELLCQLLVFSTVMFLVTLAIIIQAAS